MNPTASIKRACSEIFQIEENSLCALLVNLTMVAALVRLAQKDTDVQEVLTLLDVLQANTPMLELILVT